MYIRQLILCLLLCGQASAGLLQILADDDAYMNYTTAQAKGYNYGVGQHVKVANDDVFPKNLFIGIVGFGDLSSFPSDSILDSAKVRLYAENIVAGGNVTLTAGLRPACEGNADGGTSVGGLCYYDWCYPDSEWNDFGAQMASDDSAWCPHDGEGDVGADKRSTSESTVNVTSNNYYYWNIDTNIIRKVLDGDYAELVFIVEAATNVDVKFIADGHVVDPQDRGRLYLYYHAPAAEEEETKGVFRNNLSGKSGKFEKRR